MPGMHALGNVLILTSQSESCRLLVNEAMDLDCPAIISDHVGRRGGLVVKGRTGWDGSIPWETSPRYAAVCARP